MEHITKWRGKFWVLGFYERRADGRLSLAHSLCLTPADLEPWVRDLEDKIRPDIELAERPSRLLTLDDLHVICGKRTEYEVNRISGVSSSTGTRRTLPLVARESRRTARWRYSKLAPNTSPSVAQRLEN